MVKPIPMHFIVIHTLGLRRFKYFYKRKNVYAQLNNTYLIGFLLTNYEVIVRVYNVLNII